MEINVFNNTIVHFLYPLRVEHLSKGNSIIDFGGKKVSPAKRG